jgi:TonB family protein
MTAVIATLALVCAGCYTSSTTTVTTAPEPEAKVVKKKPRRVTDEPQPGCDEVSCVLGNYEGACCAKYKQPRPGVVGAPQQTRLDRQQIQTAITAVRPHLSSCSNLGITGTVKVMVIVAPDGSITQTKVTSSPDPAIDACVIAAVNTAVFPATDLGGTFSYPFVF